jgi:hypothetical protein
MCGTTKIIDPKSITLFLLKNIAAMMAGMIE